MEFAEATELAQSLKNRGVPAAVLQKDDGYATALVHGRVVRVVDSEDDLPAVLPAVPPDKLEACTMPLDVAQRLAGIMRALDISAQVALFAGGEGAAVAVDQTLVTVTEALDRIYERT